MVVIALTQIADSHTLYMVTLTFLSFSTSSPCVSVGCTGCRSHDDACVELSPSRGVCSPGPHMYDEGPECREY